MQFNTDHLLHKWLKNADYANNIKEFLINNEVVPLHQRGCLTYSEIETNGIVMPLKFQFKKFFEQNDVLIRTMDRMQFLQNQENLTNFVQGKLWKHKQMLNSNKYLIPYLLYIDDVEINNPLGSHAGVHQICNVYLLTCC